LTVSDAIITDPSYGTKCSFEKNFGKIQPDGAGNTKRYWNEFPDQMSWDKERVDQKYFDLMLEFKNQIIWSPGLSLRFFKKCDCVLKRDSRWGRGPSTAL